MALVSVIKFEGDNQTFIWKHPCEDFNTGSQLIVHESQEAFFFLNGQILDSFGPGRHELSTQNLPLVNHLVNLPTGGDSPFHAEVFFVNLCEQMGIAWGTSSKVQYIEPNYGFPLAIGASGEMALAVRNPRALIIKLVGTEVALSQQQLIHYFRSFLQTRVKSAIAKAIERQKLSIFEIDSQLDNLSAEVKELLKPDFAEYGIELTQMMITTVVKPDGDAIYEHFKTLQFRQFADVRDAQINQQVSIINQETEAKKTAIQARASADKRQIEGYTYQQERGFDVAEQMAQNEAIGEFANMGIGLGVMSGIGAPISQMVGGAVFHAVGDNTQKEHDLQPHDARCAPEEQTAVTANTLPNFCFNCGHKFGESENFCPECGEKR